MVYQRSMGIAPAVILAAVAAGEKGVDWLTSGDQAAAQQAGQNAAAAARATDTRWLLAGGAVMVAGIAAIFSLRR